MQFSILVLDLARLPGTRKSGAIPGLPQLISEHNVTTLGLHACLHESASRTDVMLVEELASLGFKFDSVFHESYQRPDGISCGPAVVSQLPILGSAFTVLGEASAPPEENSGSVVGCRLGLSPDVTIDVYSADPGSRDEAAGFSQRAVALSHFVDHSPELFKPEPVVRKRRRGRPRKVETEPRPEPVRIVFIVCPTGSNAAPTFGKSLRKDGYMEITGEGSSLYLRPALRPTAQQTIHIAESEITALLLTFQV